MPRAEVNRAAEMEVFVRVVDRGGFTAAAREFRLTPSAVSKLISRLEARLSTRLINRSTRQLRLTPEGHAFYNRATRVLADLDEAEHEAAAGAAPRGHLRINCNIPYGKRYVLPLIPEFLARYPEVTLDVVLSDIVIDLLQERADVAIRVGPLRESRLVARKLGSSRLVVVASPNYLKRQGVPQVPDDLARHQGIGWTFTRLLTGWPFRKGRGIASMQARTVASASDGDTARDLALGGVGLARLALFQVWEDIAQGRLVPVLQEFNPGDREDIHAIYLGQGGPLPARARALIDFLAARVRSPDPALEPTRSGRWRVVNAPAAG